MLFSQALVTFLLSATALAMPGDWQKDHDYEKSICKTKTKYDYSTYTDKVYKTLTTYKTDIETKYKTDVETKYKTDVATKYKTEVKTVLETKTYPYEEKKTKEFLETKTMPFLSTVTEFKPVTKTGEVFETVCRTVWEGDHYSVFFS